MDNFTYGCYTLRAKLGHNILIVLGKNCDDMLAREYFNCSASMNREVCRNVLTSDRNKIWTTYGNSWIDIQFNAVYNVSKISINGIGKNLVIEFLGTQFFVKDLQNKSGWSDLEVFPFKVTDSINISVTGNRNETNVAEIRVYGCPGNIK